MSVADYKGDEKGRRKRKKKPSSFFLLRSCLEAEAEGELNLPRSADAYGRRAAVDPGDSVISQTSPSLCD
jgi:hypothetical protein